jgi:hypothetical protein
MHSPLATAGFFSAANGNDMDKCIDEIKLHLPEALKRDIQDAAMQDDRKVSEWIRHELQTLILLRKSGIMLLNIQNKASGE